MLSRLSVKRPYTVIVGVVLILILGYISFTKMTTDLLPSINLPYAVVVTTYPGASPEEVETEVTAPIESAMATTSNIKGITSVSSDNVSMVILEFEQNANMDSITIDMRESLDQVSSGWDEMISSPIIMKLNPDMLPIMVAAVSREGYDDAEITEFVQGKILAELESLEGVASVSASGEIIEDVQIILKQDKIDATNERIKKALDDKFADATSQLNSALSELKDGKNQLSNGQQELNNKVTDAENEIQNNRMDIASGKAVIDVKLEELAMQEKELLAKEAEMIATETTLKAAKTQLTQLIDLLNKKTELEGAVTTLEAQILAAGSLPEPQKTQTLQTLNAQLTQTQAGLVAVNSGISAAEAAMGGPVTLADANTRLAEVNAGLAEINDGKATLTSAKAAIVSGKQILNDTKKDLEAGRVAVSEAVKQLNEGTLIAQSQIDEGLAAIVYGEQQINSAKEELDKTKDSAYESASLDNILTMDMLKQILTAQNFSMPAGYITEDGTSYLVRVGDEVEDSEALAELVLMDMGMEGLEPIKLSDVAEVIVTDNSAEVYAKVNGNNGIILTMEKQTGYSTGDVANRIKDKFEALTEEYEGLAITPLMDQGIYIDFIVDSVLSNIISGGILAVVILFLFLKDYRPTLVIACSIPVSIITAIVLMYFSGVTINLISLSGLALGVGMLVDNSIVVIENIYRMKNEGMSIKKACVEGAKEVAGAITISTLTTVSVFLPIVFTEGITRQLFVEMGLTIAYSLLASLVIALTFVPMMGTFILKKVKEPKPGIVDKIQYVYTNILDKVLKKKAIVFLVSILLLVGSVFAAGSKGTAFIPDMESNQATVTLETPEEKTMAETAEITDEAVERLLEISDVTTVGAMIGSNNSMSLMGGKGSDNSVTMYLILKEDKELSGVELEKEILGKTKDLECEVSVSTSQMDMSMLGGSGISVKVKGQNTDELQRMAKEIAALISDVEGVKEVSDGIGETTPELRISVDKEKAAAKSLTVAQVFMAISNELADTSKATSITTNGKEYDVYIVDEENKELSRDDIKKLEISVTTKEGTKETVKLSDVATFSDADGLSSISREGQQRYLSVTAQIDAEHNVGLVGNDIEKIVKDYETPKGYEVEMAGESEVINEAMDQMVLMLVVAVAFVYLIMVAQFQSLLSPFIIMFTIPLAFTGGLFALFIADSEISIIAMIGFVMLAGIIVNNGIVLVDYINQLRRRGMDKKDAIIEAGKTRLRPILMTALTTILGLSTMAFSAGMGADMAKPMAVVTIGGMIYGTLLTLFVIPCIYDAFNKNKSMVEEEI